MAADVPRVQSFASLSSAYHLPSSSPDTPRSPKVRFDHDCVVIPDPAPASRLPRLVTKSYALPLWKRKRDPSQLSESDDDPSDDHVVFKVSVPTITTKARSPSREPPHSPLVSCLIHPDHLSPADPTRRGRPRRASLPQPTATDAITVPLRSCCAQCYSSIDKCISEGDHWQVHFSRGALRRRKSVSDAHIHPRTRHCLRDAMPGFDAIVAVDEVDRRRKHTEIDALTAFTIELPPTSIKTTTPSEDIPLRRALSLPNAVHPARSSFLPEPLPRTLSPPIKEEDEQRPTPRRTPAASPRDSLSDLAATRTTDAANATELSDAEATPPMTHAPSEDSNSSTDSKLISSPMSSLTDDDRETISSWFSSPTLAHRERSVQILLHHLHPHHRSWTMRALHLVSSRRFLARNRSWEASSAHRHPSSKGLPAWAACPWPYELSPSPTLPVLLRFCFFTTTNSNTVPYTATFSLAFFFRFLLSISFSLQEFFQGSDGVAGQRVFFYCVSNPAYISNPCPS
uniref:Acid phosphatase n=1 Tax=Ganoderma boninense TaxID=34458 RepID=A0A5K1K793_9APHY|nr:Acid phosphatase [Ganoderma boninense]